ncbi:hypothetical protein F5884DRAFT_401297 [Xylogone sp. PMI_703]|nr:hypothetical protein F5884DRAFT_401297 [Xylogone sp. PMI_703]
MFLREFLPHVPPPPPSGEPEPTDPSCNGLPVVPTISAVGASALTAAPATTAAPPSTRTSSTYSPSTTSAAASCPLGRPNLSDCEAARDMIGTSPTARVPSSSSCFSGDITGTDTDVWCDYYTSDNCQISIGYDEGFGDPLSPPPTQIALTDLMDHILVAVSANPFCGGSLFHVAGNTVPLLVSIKQVGFDCLASDPGANFPVTESILNPPVPTPRR